MRNDLISISAMAELYGISRQTLIYYDEIDLFKPEQVDDKGYRYYSRRQIPYLREICFLKSIGVSLKDIQSHFNGRCASKEMELLKKQKEKLDAEIARLNHSREAINQRMSIYEEAVDADLLKSHEPFIQHIVTRKVLFKEYLQPIDREHLHLTLMSMWKEVFRKETVPTGGFGSMFKQAAVLAGAPLQGAGSCILLPSWVEEYADTIVVPEGNFACMYKYGMPYETRHIQILLQWIKAEGYELCGDIIDVCLLDTTFYQEQKKMDFCLLQAPVKKR